MLLLVVVFAAFLRLWRLDLAPPSVSLDEASIGWNAYSVLKTGADEYGNRLPVLLRSYDDWRPALYVYLIIPFVKILGLSVWSIRLPAAILGILTVLATYFLTKELLSDAKFQNPNVKSIPKSKCQILREVDFAALMATGLLAVSPWHIYISRLGHEVNAGLAFMVFGVLFFLKAVGGKKQAKKLSFMLGLAAVFFALSFMGYQAEKVVLPVFVLGLFILFRNELLKMKKPVVLAGLLGMALLLPFVKASLAPEALIRFQGTRVFERSFGVFGNLKLFLSQYFSHFNPKWLFFNSGKENHKVPNMGLLYWWEGLLIFAGLLEMLGRFKKKAGKRTAGLVLLWLLTAPLAAAMTTQAPHAMRSFTFLPIWQVLGALGGLAMIRLTGCVLCLRQVPPDAFPRPTSSLSGEAGSLRSLDGGPPASVTRCGKKVVGVVTLLLAGLAGISLFSFYKNYFLVFPKEQSNSFQYALGRAIPFVLENEEKYDKIIFSNEDNLYQSYMFFLYYSQYDPKLYQAQRGTISGGFAETHRFGKYEFRPIDWEKEDKSEQVLFAGNPRDFPKDAAGVFESYYLDGTLGVRIVERRDD